MKRIGLIYSQIYTYENLCMAFMKAAKGKHLRKDVIIFKETFDSNINKLQQQLIEHSPDIGNYIFFKVHDPKPRDICAANFNERILHHAIMNVCEPYLDSFAIYDSYACRKNKGSHRAVKRAKSFCNKYKWYLKMDVKKYFDSIDHLILIELLARRFKDVDLLDLFSKIFNTYHTQTGKGLPIGNLISQHSANFYLGTFDHWIKETLKINGYIRYMDDFLVFGTSRHHLKETLKRIKHYLNNRLSLNLKSNVQLNKTKYGIPFLGYRVFPEKILLNTQSRKRFIDKFKLYENNWLTGKWNTEELVRHVEPLMAFAQKADTHGFRNNIINKFGVWT